MPFVFQGTDQLEFKPNGVIMCDLRPESAYAPEVPGSGGTEKLTL